MPSKLEQYIPTLIAYFNNDPGTMKLVLQYVNDDDPYGLIELILSHPIKTHWLKTEPAFFREIVTGSKTFEVRNNDRGFEVGDVLILQEYLPAWAPKPGYSGRQIKKKISYILDDPRFCREGYVILGLRD